MDNNSRYATQMPNLSYDSRTGGVTYSVFRNPLVTSAQEYGTYLWKQSDRWDLLAMNYFGNPQQWHALVDANPHIQDPHMVEPGTVIRIPLVD